MTVTNILYSGVEEIIIRSAAAKDKDAFLNVMLQSKHIHQKYVPNVPYTSDEYGQFLARFDDENNINHLCIFQDKIFGVINISNIVRGLFQSAFIGYYGSVISQNHKGIMTLSMQAVLKKAFQEYGLHRLEANIQPDNYSSINFIRRNGFKKEGYSPRYLKIDGEWKDHERWALTYEDWQIFD